MLSLGAVSDCNVKEAGSTQAYHGSSDSLIGDGFLLLSGRKSKNSLILQKIDIKNIDLISTALSSPAFVEHGLTSRTMAGN